MATHRGGRLHGAAARIVGSAAPASWTLRIAAVAAVAAVASSGGSSPRTEAEPPEAAAAPRRMVWLDQNWSDAQRREYHHVSQGTFTFPIPTSWFMALERPTILPSGMFADSAYLDRFGFIPSPGGDGNPLGLPIGFARTVGTNPSDGRPIDSIGFTCAACHTGRIDFGGTSMLIDGGPALTDLGKFRSALGLALGFTVFHDRFERFADRVLGPNRTKAQSAMLRKALENAVKIGLGQQLQAQKLKGSVKEGFGRLDALNRIGNEVFGDQLGIPANNVAFTAPVAYPHIWDTAWFDWVQYNSSIEQPMVRNAGEAMGVVARVNFNGDATPRFTSTIPVDRLHDAIEEALGGKDQPLPARKWSGLRSPKWPSDILPPIDRELAAKGAALYQQNCKGCHLPAPNTDAFWEDRHWLEPNEHGQRYLKLETRTTSFMGTDPAQAAGMAARTVRVPASFGLKRQVGTASDGNPTYGFGDALGQVVELVVNRWYDSHGTKPDDRIRMNGYRLNGIQAPLAYKARPLNGIWATAPYLHNGSVPTLYDLLSPWAERNRNPIFWLGNRQYDPVKVGYLANEIKGAFKLDTRLAGNRNTGHLFETPRTQPGTIGRGLSPEERWALIEYLKTL